MKLNWTLAIFKSALKIVVFANEVKQSRPIFNCNSALDCFANARKDRVLTIFLKMDKVQLKGFIFFGFFLCTNLFAKDVTFLGLVEQPIAPQKNRCSTSQLVPAPKNVTLLYYQLSNHALNKLSQRADACLRTPYKGHSTSKLPPRVQLGMNGVPVFDQGKHGTCVTFANTAALDALLGKGDYISQLCLLQLGQHLKYQAYASSGWKGANGFNLLSRLTLFGIVSKENQKTHGCAGLYEYPLSGSPPETEMTLQEYHALSEKLPHQILLWSPLLDKGTTFGERVDTAKTLEKVKQSLNEGDRVTFASFLLRPGDGSALVAGRYHAPNDTFVLTIEMIRELYLKNKMGGHEMLITGYDDEAVAVDDEGREYQGLLMIRNSWGKGAGDHGEYYMTYDYFKTFVKSAQRIRSNKK